jgi:hypothetical protein
MAKFFETIKETESLTNNSCLQQITEKLPVWSKIYISDVFFE